MKTWLPIFFCFAVFGQEITLKQVMEDPYWIGEIPENLTFSLDGKTVYFQIPQPIPHPDQWKAMDVASKAIRDIQREDMPEILRTDSLSFSGTTALAVDGDLWVAKENQSPMPLFVDSNGIRLIRFNEKGDLIYRAGHVVFRTNLNNGQTIRLTDLRFTKKSEEKETWYSREEKEMLQFVNDLYTAEESREAQRKQRRLVGPIEKPEPTYLGSDMELAGLFGPESRFAIDLSPDERFLTVVLEPEKEGESTEYADFINKEAAVKAKKARPKVGHSTPTWKLAVLDRQTQTLNWLDLEGLPEIKRDPLKEIKESLSEDDKKFLPADSEDNRPVMLLPGGFNPKGNRFLLTAYSRDYKDRWVFLVDPESMEKELIHHHYDEAWVPHILRNIGVEPYVSGSAFWTRNGEHIAFLSDHQGYQNLYLYTLKSKNLRPIVEGTFEVHSPYESKNGKHWYFHATKDHPGVIQFYKVPLTGGAAVQLTNGTGHQLVTLSPNEETMAGLFSTTNQPPVLMLATKKSSWKLAYDGRSDQFRTITWTEPEVLTYPNRDGKPVYARLYKPEKSNGAGVIFVHGAGYLQNAHKGWSTYFREYMFHNLLQREGYTVLDPDYQASAGYGRDWRTAIYRHMGGKDLNDIVDGANFLAAQPGVEKGRLGLYGGSYGGFMALMAMFTTPDVFQSGAALRPVTDWAYYNHWYTSRILNTPFNDPEAYRKSSPIYFAEGLKGHLLIAHGMVDDNVHYQDSVRLAQKLIELRKHNWELSSYPVEPHGFRTPTSWYDEYRRIYELFQKTLR